MTTPTIVELVRQRASEARRDIAKHYVLIGLCNDGPEAKAEAAQIVDQSSEQDVRDFLKSIATAWVEHDAFEAEDEDLA